MRIFAGGIIHETNSFHPQLTRVESFEIHRAAALLDDPGVKPFRENEVEVIPSLWPEAIPSGPVEYQTYRYFRDSLLDDLQACGTVDGVCLFLHGAMVVDGIGCGEMDLVRSIREIVGPDVLISASLDLHGNIDPDLGSYANILTAYRTAPHIDMEETRQRAASLLIHCIKNRLKPVPVIVKIPVMIAGDPAITDEQPAADLYAKLLDIDKVPGIVTSSLMIGYSWSDIPNIGSSTIVVAENEKYRDVAVTEASSLAADFWSKRGDFSFTVPTGTIEESIGIAEDFADGPVFISDSGDNVTSGAAGDVPSFVEKLLAADVRNVVVAGIIDSRAVDVCRKTGVGSSANLSLGGKIDTVNAKPLPVDGKVVHLTDSGAVLRSRGVDIIIAEKRTAFSTIDSFAAFDVNPAAYKVVVVKLGYLFPELKEIAKHTVLAFSPGFASQKLDLPYKNIPRPIYPLDPGFDWAPPRDM